MKTLVLGLIFLGFTTLMQSQNEIAALDANTINVNTNNLKKPLKRATINSSYYFSFDNKIISGRARKFQNIVASYDIKESLIYSSVEKSNYTVVFREGENQIKAEYDQEGKIVQCKELFKGIKLPYTISSDIAKQYPGWKFCEVSCEVLYANENDQQVVYKVAIQNGNKKKTLKLNAQDYKL